MYYSLFTSLVTFSKIKRAFPMHFPTPHLKNVTIFLKACHA